MALVLECRRGGARVIDELGRELAAVGIRGRLRRRILAELGDHLDCDPEAQLGEPRALARQFADELGTSRSRRAAFAGFGALAVAGLAYTVAFVAESGVSVPDSPAHSRVLGALAGAALVVAPQVAFVAGALALVRAFRHRRDRALPAGEVRLLRRRTWLALAAGAAAMGATALFGYEYGVSTGIAYVAAAVGGGAILLAAPTALAGARVHATAPGDADDVFADLGPLVPASLRDAPWRFARTVALLVGIAVAVAGVLQSDPFDGLLRGLAESLACFAGFAAFGRFLGLRR
jgi:hypothetical protein